VAVNAIIACWDAWCGGVVGPHCTQVHEHGDSAGDELEWKTERLIEDVQL